MEFQWGVEVQLMLRVGSIRRLSTSTMSSEGIQEILWTCSPRRLTSGKSRVKYERLHRWCRSERFDRSVPPRFGGAAV